jgi:hypothetical protein
MERKPAAEGRQGRSGGADHARRRGRAQGALRGNVEAIENKLTGQGPLHRRPGRRHGLPTPSTPPSRSRQAVGAAYDAARSAAATARFLPAEQRPIVAQHLREAIKDYDPENRRPGRSVLDAFDGTPGTLTPRDLFEARSKLTKLRATNDPQGRGRGGNRPGPGRLHRRRREGRPDQRRSQGGRGCGKRPSASASAFGKLFEGKD